MNETQELMNLLEKALDDQVNGIPMPRKEFGITQGAMIDLSKQEYEPAKKYFVKLLDNSLPYIQQEALVSLARYHGDESYLEFIKQKAIELFNAKFNSKDIEFDIKFTAMNILSGFKEHADANLMKLFYSVLSDRTLNIAIRSCAFQGIYDAAKIMPKKSITKSVAVDCIINFSCLDDDSKDDVIKFENSLDWIEIKSIVKEYLSEIDDSIN